MMDLGLVAGQEIVGLRWWDIQALGKLQCNTAAGGAIRNHCDETV
jgi:hypothetical protein